MTILRDKWGIPHVFGKADADAVFGMIYARAEDDSALWRDLRMKLYIQPDDMKVKPKASTRSRPARTASRSRRAARMTATRS